MDKILRCIFQLKFRMWRMLNVLGYLIIFYFYMILVGLIFLFLVLNMYFCARQCLGVSNCSPYPPYIFLDSFLRRIAWAWLRRCITMSSQIKKQKFMTSNSARVIHVLYLFKFLKQKVLVHSKRFSYDYFLCVTFQNFNVFRNS